MEDRYVGNAFLFDEKEKKSFLKTYNPAQSYTELTRDIFAQTKGEHPMIRMQYCDLMTWLRGDILVKGDRLSMAHSLEVRVPFLDREVWKFASSLSVDEKLRKVPPNTCCGMPLKIM